MAGCWVSSVYEIINLEFNALKCNPRCCLFVLAPSDQVVVNQRLLQGGASLSGVVKAPPLAMRGCQDRQLNAEKLACGILSQAQLYRH
jgi:hypothetical protein